MMHFLRNFAFAFLVNINTVNVSFRHELITELNNYNPNAQKDRDYRSIKIGFISFIDGYTKNNFKSTIISN